MKKKVLALIMAFALVASLTACGNTDDNNSSKDSNSGTASTVEKEEAKDTADTENTDFSSRDDQKKMINHPLRREYPKVCVNLQTDVR